MKKPFQSKTSYVVRDVFAESVIKAAMPMDTTDMWWKTRDGKRMKASEMSPTHMFYSLRLLYNKCVPAEFQLVAGNTQVTTQNRDHRSAMGILFGLLAQGDRMEQLSDEMLEQLVYMQKVVREKL